MTVNVFEILIVVFCVTVLAQSTTTSDVTQTAPSTSSSWMIEQSMNVVNSTFVLPDNITYTEACELCVSNQYNFCAPADQCNKRDFDRYVDFGIYRDYERLSMFAHFVCVNASKEREQNASFERFTTCFALSDCKKFEDRENQTFVDYADNFTASPFYFNRTAGLERGEPLCDPSNCENYKDKVVPEAYLNEYAYTYDQYPVLIACGLMEPVDRYRFLTGLYIGAVLTVVMTGVVIFACTRGCASSESLKSVPPPAAPGSGTKGLIIASALCLPPAWWMFALWTLYQFQPLAGVGSLVSLSVMTVIDFAIWVVAVPFSIVISADDYNGCVQRDPASDSCGMAVLWLIIVLVPGLVIHCVISCCSVFAMHRMWRTAK